MSGGFDTPRALRIAARSGRFGGHTAGQTPGFVQGNVAILPARLAHDFRVYCERNPGPCPLLAMSEPGEVTLPDLGDDIDIRTDVPRYRVFLDGKLTGETDDITSLWRGDLVTFVLGCSYSFEEALEKEGLALRHVECDCAVPMYRSSIETEPSGSFSGPMVVSMRPFAPDDAQRARAITSRYPRVHGEPVHIGAPRTIGIDNLARPDYGDAVPLNDGELPVFWACGVTPQVAIERAAPDLCITHNPGAMLVTDLLNEDLAETR